MKITGKQTKIEKWSIQQIIKLSIDGIKTQKKIIRIKKEKSQRDFDKRKFKNTIKNKEESKGRRKYKGEKKERKERKEKD
jgi:hypothetical protein